MTALDNVKATLSDSYRHGLVVKQESLKLSLEELKDGNPAAAQAIRRLAHQLNGSGGTYGFPGISECAAEVEAAAEGAALIAATQQLLAVLTALVPETRRQTEILLVEDDQELAAAIAERLRLADRAITTTTSVAEARALLGRKRFEAIILDLYLQDKDGRELLTSLRGSLKKNDVAVVVVSGQTDDETKLECLALGADLFLHKPLSPSLLSIALTSMLERRALLTQTGHIDPLTGLLNRWSVEDLFARLMAASERAGSPLAVAMLDLDRFKAINDTYGHGSGDQVLQHSARLLSNALRQSDIVVRWGGEEFVVLMPGATAPDAVRVLQKLMKVLRRQVFATPQGGFEGVTFSGGVSVACRGDTLGSVVERADALLYLAKSKGRGRILHQKDTDTGKHGLVLVENGADGVQAFLIADRVYRDPGSDQYIIAKTLHRLTVATFPAVFHRPIGVFIKLAGRVGTVWLDLSFEDQATGETLLRTPPLEVVGDDPTQAVELALDVPALPLPHPGRYLFKLQIDGDVLGTAALDVLAAPDDSRTRG